MAPVGWWQVGRGEDASVGTVWNTIAGLHTLFQNLIPLFPCAASWYFQCITVITRAAHVQGP